MDLGSTGMTRSEREVDPRLRRASSVAALGIVLIVAALGNLFITHDNHLFVTLFAIEILLAVIWFALLTSIVISVIAIATYIATAIVDHQPFVVVLFGAGGLVIVAYLAVGLSRERGRSREATEELWQANEALKQTEDRLRIGLSMANVTVTCQDRDLNYTAVYNARPELPAAALFENAGQGLLSPEDVSLLTTIKRRVLDTGVSERADLQFTIAGVTRDYDMHIVPQRSSSSEIVGIIGSSTEVTARRQANETRLFEATILQNIRDSVIASDLDGLVTYWNHGAERLFGYTASEVVGKRLSLLSLDQDPAMRPLSRERILAGGEYSGEILERGKGGRDIWVDLKISALRDAERQPIGFLRVASDITDRKRLEAEREELLKRETTALHRLQQFVALVAHDLDQPLTTIYGLTQLLERVSGDPAHETEHRHIRSIRLATERMSRLTGDLRQSIAIGSGHFEVNREPMDLIRSIRSVVAEQQRQTRQHELVLNGPAELNGSWDRDRIIQMMTNLITNAIKYSPEGGTVAIDVADEADDVTIQVRDSGIGMTKEQIERLFEPFSRVHDDVRVSGTGLGLYITRGIVQAHNGHIRVTSKPGEGSLFAVTLPKQATGCG